LRSSFEAGIKKVFLLFAMSSLFLMASEDIKKSGDALLVLMPLSALSASYYIDDKKGDIELIKSLTATVAATEALKYATHKKRPDGKDFESFPSGHTSVTFSTAAYIHKRYGFERALLPYLAASYVGYSRVYSKQHYLEDVVAGAAVGILSSFYFTTENETFRITPLISKGFYGINIALQF